MALTSPQMHIAIIDHVGRKAGMDSYSGGLGEALSELGCDVHVLSNFSGTATAKATYHLLFDGHSQTSSAKKLIKYVSGVLRSARTALKHDCDYAIFHLFSADYPALLLSIILTSFRLRPIVIAHDVASFADDDHKWIQSVIYNWLSRYVIVHNDYSRRALLSTVKIRQPTKVKVVRHGAAEFNVVAKVDRSAARQRLGLALDQKYLLFFGQIKTVKGLDILIEALTHVGEDIHLIIAGKPWRDDYQTYKNAISQKGLGDRVVEMIGFVEDDTRDLLFSAADALVLPYRKIYQSGVLLMGMTHGVALIASDLEPNRDVIVDGINGLLFRAGDPIDLARAIDRFFSDGNLPELLTTNATRTIRDKFSWQAIAREYVTFLNSSRATVTSS